VTTVKITAINLRNTFRTEYCKNTFLNPDFCNFKKFQIKSKFLVKPTWSEIMTVLGTFFKSSLNFLTNNIKKQYKNLVQSGRKAVSKF